MADTLIVITGPTASGKTDLAIAVARLLGCHIINADSRQVFREIPICTAAPTTEQLAMVPHHMVGTRSVTEAYNASQYEHDVLELLPSLFARGGGRAVMCGGSMMYIDAVCRGIDAMPDVKPEVRQAVLDDLHEQGLEALLDELRQRDPAYHAIVDRANPRRVVHALELCRQTGGTYTALRLGIKHDRPFNIVKFALDVPRDQLFERINARVDAMIAAGLVEEARAMLPLRHLQALNTVGMKEMFAYLDGQWDLPTAVARLQKNTRVYAKKQLTWLRRDPDITWLSPGEALSTILGSTGLND